MKIVIVTHVFSENDGQGKVNLEVARGAALAGHEVHLVAEEVAPALLELPGIAWTRVSHGPLPTNLAKQAWFAWASGRVLDRLRDWADITVANGAVTRGSVDVNAVHFVHSGWRTSPYFDPGKGPRGLYRRFYAWANSWLERRAFRNARCIVPVSQQVAGELRAIGVDPTRINVIANGVDTEKFNPSGTKATINVPQGELRALFVGDIVSSRKGLDTAIAAVRQVEGVTLVVVGRTTGSPYPDQVREAGLDHKVIFLDFRRDIPDIMRACDVFVFPSRYEPCGLVLLEAAASGLPSITASNAGASEILGDDACLKIANPDDAKELCTHLVKIASDAELRASMKSGAIKTASAFSWDKMSHKYITLFSKLLENKN